MSGIRHMTLGAVASAVASSVEVAVQPCTVGYTPPEEGGGGGPTSWTFTIDPAYFFYDPGEEFGGPQVTSMVMLWSSGIYWEFQDESSTPLLVLYTTGTGHYIGTEVADISAFQTVLGAALDTQDAGLSVTIDGNTFTVTFTAAPSIGSTPIAYLSMVSEVGDTPSFSNPAALVAV